MAFNRNTVCFVIVVLLTYLPCSLGVDKCNGPVGLTNETLFPKKMFSTKFGGKPDQARLNHKTIGWCPSDPLFASMKRNHYLEVNLGQQYRLQAIVTQGSGESAKKVTKQRFAKSYRVMYKHHAEAPWRSIKGKDGKKEKIFKGNTDNISPVKNSFTEISPFPLYASAVRVVPWEYAKDNACLKLELYGCKVSTLKYLTCHQDANCDDKARCNKYNFKCECLGNYTGDGVFCSDIDECSRKTHSCKKEDGEKCENFGGGYSCVCREGFIKRGAKCRDVNECAIKSDKSPVCGPTIAGDCKNIKGGYECSCRSGFKSLHSNKKGPCVDIDECQEGTHNCGEIENSYCFNLNGSSHYTCKCQKGFKMAGTTCEATGFLAAFASIAPYLAGIFGLVILILIPVILVMILRWRRIMKEEQEFMMNPIDPTNQMYFGEVDSGWSVGMDEEPQKEVSNEQHE